MNVIPLTQEVTAAPRRFGQYFLIRKLAEGGMAEIFLAKQAGAEGFERNCVVKCMLPHFTNSKEFVAMFLDEARLAAKLHHPNIVQISDLGIADGRYFICMEYLAGEDLQSIIEKLAERGRKVPIGLAVKIIHSACEGLEFAHGFTEANKPMNLVHRDISPSNIFVTYQGTVKVLDFGIAKAASKAVKTEAGTVKGKWGYMSPEQARGDELDGRSDIFSVGVTLHELLTGERVFKRDNELAVLIAMMNEAVPPPSTIRPDVPPELDDIVAKCLARNRDQRFRNTGELRIALENFMAAHASLAGASQMGMFMLEVFGAEQANQRTQIPSLAEINSGVMPILPDLDPRFGTDPTAVRKSDPGADRVPLAPPVPTVSTSIVAPQAKAVEPVAPAKSSAMPVVLTALVALAAGGAGVFYFLQQQNRPVVVTDPTPPVSVVLSPPVVVEKPPEVVKPPVVQDAPPPENVIQKPVQPAKKLAPDDVNIAIGKSGRQFKACMRKFKADQPAERIVRVALVVKRNGTTGSAAFVTPGVAGTDFGKCVAGVLMSLKFPRNSNDPEFAIEMPLRFTIND